MSTPTPKTIAELIRSRTGGGESARRAFMKPLMARAINAAVESQLHGRTDDDAFAAARDAFDRELAAQMERRYR